MSNSVLQVQGVSKRFGGVQALSNVSMHIPRGSIYGLIGPNGAGKTTFFNVITGLYSADSGHFVLSGQPYRPQAIDKVVQAGIARTFQNIRLFGRMSALENVMVARHGRSQTSVWGALLRHKACLQEEAQIRDFAMQCLQYVGVAHLAQADARSLSYGDQRRLEIARALATEPQLLALDEPAAGMNPSEKQQLRTLIERIRADGRTVLLIEHDVKLVMGLCDAITVLDYGQVIAQGTPAQVRSNEQVIQAYLGSEA